MLGSFAGGWAGVTADAEGQQPANAIASKTTNTPLTGLLSVANAARTNRASGGRCGYAIIANVLSAYSRPWTAKPASFPALPTRLLSANDMPAALNKLETNILESFKSLTMLHCGTL